MSGAGNDTINFMAGSPLNRLSWLRNSTKFINATSLSPSTRWLLYRSGDPLVYKKSGRPVELSTKRVEKLLGPTPYFGQGQQEGESALEDVSKLASARIRGPSIIFLGVWEGRGGDDSLSEIARTAVKGDAYFALDVSMVEKEILDSVQLPESTKGKSESETVYAPARIAASRFDKQQAAIFAAAKGMIEWNSRIKVLSAPVVDHPRILYGLGGSSHARLSYHGLNLGSPLVLLSPVCIPINIRGQIQLSSLGLSTRLVTRSYSDEMYAVIILALEAADQSLQKKFPGTFYSTLAGFVEPGETFEESVAREIYEESGVKVHNVIYHSTQPWPYPGNIMMGFYARADSTKPIYLDLDAELSDAKWFTRAEVQEVLSHPDGTNIAARDYKQLDNIVSGKSTDSGTSQAVIAAQKAAVNTQPPFRVPPVTSIAGTLISEWVYGKSRL